MVVSHVVHLAGADAPQKPSQILGKKSNDWFQASKTREQTKYTKQARWELITPDSVLLWWTINFKSFPEIHSFLFCDWLICQVGNSKSHSTNLEMVAYILNIQQSKFANMNSVSMIILSLVTCRPVFAYFPHVEYVHFVTW